MWDSHAKLQCHGCNGLHQPCYLKLSLNGLHVEMSDLGCWLLTGHFTRPLCSVRETDSCVVLVLWHPAALVRWIQIIVSLQGTCARVYIISGGGDAMSEPHGSVSRSISPQQKHTVCGWPHQTAERMCVTCVFEQTMNPFLTRLYLNHNCRSHSRFILNSPQACFLKTESGCL